MNKEEFIAEAIKNGLQNDGQNVWTEVNGIQAWIDVKKVIAEESYPFEASERMEANKDHPAWDDLYDDFMRKASAEK